MAQIDQQQMLPMGAVLGNRYRIVKYLASGGFGNTYVAEDTHFGRQVAVKEFFMRGTNHRSADGTTVEVSNNANIPVFNSQMEKFRREAQRIFDLRNNHIIHVSDLFDANGTSYYVMDLVNGTSLAVQTRQQPLPEQEVRDVAMQVLDALETMHAAGLYHLDVKPGNIMRDQRGHCTLIDFGASKQLTFEERATLSSSSMAYTPGYAPHEQVAQQSKNIGPWTDFYALGATLYRLATGAPPPEVEVGDTAPDGRQFPYPPYVSSSLRHAISTLMNPDHRLRPQSAAEVKALLTEKKEKKKSNKPIPWMWYAFGGVALLALVFGILLLTKGFGKQHSIIDDDDNDDDTTFVNPKDTIPKPKKVVPPPPTSFKQCPDDNHPHKIDLGLPSGTLWACCNVDAKKPEDYGGYYAWGETSTKSCEYSWDTYKHCDGTRESCHNLGSSICGTQYDVAHVKWGGSWLMPTEEQILELLDKCNKGEWMTQNGVKGRKFIGPNGGSIFLPAAGYHWGIGLGYVGGDGHYWLGTQDTEYEDYAYGLNFGSDGADRNYFNRYVGLSVRPIAR